MNGDGIGKSRLLAGSTAGIVTAAPAPEPSCHSPEPAPQIRLGFPTRGSLAFLPFWRTLNSIDLTHDEQPQQASRPAPLDDVAAAKIAFSAAHPGCKKHS